MKYLRIFIIVFVILQNFSSCCNGKPSSGPTLSMFKPRQAVDCGSYHVLNRVRAIQKSRSKSLVSSRIRAGFASFYKPVYSCLIASNVTEVSSSFQSTTVQIAIIQFNMDKSTANNDITGGRLTFSLVYPDIITEADKIHIADVRVSGSFSGFHGIPYIIPRLADGMVPTSTGNQVSYNFNALNLLRNVSWSENKVGSSKTSDKTHDGDRNEKITVNFYVSRNCDNQFIDYCPSMFNTTVHTPSLRVFYI